MKNVTYFPKQITNKNDIVLIFLQFTLVSHLLEGSCILSLILAFRQFWYVVMVEAILVCGYG